MRVIGLDVHRNFAQVAILDAGVVKDHGRFAMEREAVLAFANKVLTKEDDVVLEATGNAAIIVRLLTPFVGQVRSLDMTRHRLMTSNGQRLASAAQSIVVAKGSAAAGRNDDVKTAASVTDLVGPLARLQLSQLGFRQSVTRPRSGPPNASPIHRRFHANSDPSLVAGSDTVMGPDGIAAALSA